MGALTFDPATFDAMFERDDDPWSFRTRWYEERKRATTLAALPRPRYASLLELGCANGELAASLALRADRLVAVDASERAVALARQRLAGFAGVEVHRTLLPQEWPAGRFDLVVLSELGYYLGRSGLVESLRQAALAADELLACHWRQPIEGCELAGDEVHAVIQSELGWSRLVHVDDPDFVLDLWSRDPTSVAQREGLR